MHSHSIRSRPHLPMVPTNPADYHLPINYQPLQDGSAGSRVSHFNHSFLSHWLLYYTERTGCADCRAADPQSPKSSYSQAEVSSPATSFPQWLDFLSPGAVWHRHSMWIRCPQEQASSPWVQIKLEEFCRLRKKPFARNLRPPRVSRISSMFARRNYSAFPWRTTSLDGEIFPHR